MNLPDMSLCDRIAKDHPYPLLFATVSGAHLYGFASPDSDYDLRGAHVLPAADVLSLRPASETIDRAGVVEGVEIDLVTHDAKKYFAMLLKHNGYVLEQLLSPLVVRTSEAHRELVRLSPRFLTRFHAHHYLGFAQTQWKLFERESPPRVKPLLYVYRVLLTGIHLMRAGEINANLPQLNDVYRLAFIPDLIAEKVGSHEQRTLSGADLAFHAAEFAQLESRLREEHERTSLPAETDAMPELSDLLVRLRLEPLLAGRSGSPSPA
jgi:predicted nucleotidyltransferase